MSSLKKLVQVVQGDDFVILDTETTGLGVSAEICQIAIINSSCVTLLDTLVKPIRPIPFDAIRIHGITNDMVQDSPTWLDIHDRVWELVQDQNVIVYNADYDFRLMAQSENAPEPFIRNDWSTIKRFCAMDAYAEHVGDWNDYHGNYRWQKLVDAAREARYRLPDGVKPHSAAADCLMTLAVCRFLAQVHP